MMPADQGFETVDFAGGERHGRLVHELEFMSLQCPAHVRLELDPADQALVHSLFETFDTALSASLGLIHGGVGISEEIDRLFQALVSSSRANRCAHEDLRTMEHHGSSKLIQD